MLSPPYAQLLADLQHAWQQELVALLYLRQDLDVKAAGEWSVADAAAHPERKPLDSLQHLADLLMRGEPLPWEVGPPKPGPVGLLNAFSRRA